MIPTRNKKQIVEMILNWSGLRNTSRILGMSINTVLSESKKEKEIRNVNYALLKQRKCDDIEVEIVQKLQILKGVLYV